MSEDGLLLLTGSDVLTCLKGREREILDAVARAYVLHDEGASSLPHSSFLRFPNQERDRIISLPAFLGGELGVAGVKWIASFPGNLEQGLDRASAVMVLNSSRTGRPTGVFEASVISAKRTAASAALAAERILAGRAPERVAAIGCGLIQFEILRFLKAALAGLGTVRVFDLDPARADQLAGQVRTRLGLEVETAASIYDVLADADLVSFATTAGTPHLDSLLGARPDATVLHISLRDLAPAVILAGDNLVDDIDHAVRAQTSLHLTEGRVGHRDFIRATLGAVLRGLAPARLDDGRPTIFSPFGLGILDLAVADLTARLAREQGAGLEIQGFLPPSWVEWS